MRGLGRSVGGAGADVSDMSGAVARPFPWLREAVEAAAAATAAAADPLPHWSCTIDVSSTAPKHGVPAASVAGSQSEWLSATGAAATIAPVARRAPRLPPPCSDWALFRRQRQQNPQPSRGKRPYPGPVTAERALA